jgi:hypothetical protein
MIGVLVRLQWMQLKGRVIRSIRLLRQPKYLVGFIVGVAWMWLWVVRSLLRSRLHFASAAGSQFGMEFLPVFHHFAALAVTVALPLPWLLPWGRLGLPFRESELTMLLQAPLSRRQVIQYGLLKSEVRVLLSGLILPLFVGLGGPGTRLLMAGGTWMLFEFWHLNGKWRALFNLRQTEVPVALARARRVLLTIGLLGYYAVVLSALIPFVTQLAGTFGGRDYRQVVASLSEVTWPPLLKAFLTPAWWLTAPMFAGAATAFVVAAAPVLLAILAQREIVVRSKARFEESALEHATKEEVKKSPAQRFSRISSRARVKRPFELNHRGPPESWNNDLRTELAHIELVRTWPVSARRFVLAEVISPALLSFAASAFGAGIVLTSLFGSRLREALTGHPSTLVLLPRSAEFMGVNTAVATVLIFASFLPMAAAVSFFSSALQNLATLFVPAWMAHGSDRSQGFAAFGQRMLFAVALGLALFLALTPSALLVGAAAGLQWWLGIPWSAWAFPLWGVLAAAPLAALGWFIVQVAGRLWERLDPSQEILELGR